MVLLDSVRVSRDRTYSGTNTGARTTFEYGTVTRYGSAFHRILLADEFVTPQRLAPRPRLAEAKRFRLFPFRSPLLRKSSFLSFPTVTEMFQFTALALYAYVFNI
jgi:hypothetical protein